MSVFMNKPANDQSSDMDYANGQGGEKISYKQKNKWAHNQHTGVSNEDHGITGKMGPRVGNKSDSADDVGPSATRDKKRMTIATASEGGKIDGGTTVKRIANPDRINAGK